MKSVFTKTWIQVVLLLCLAFVASALITRYTLDHNDFLDFRIDAATDSELIAYRMASHDVENWEEFLADYQTEFNLRVGGVLVELDESWQLDKEIPSLYTKSIESDPWETAWNIPDTHKYLWLIDREQPSQLNDLVETFWPLALIFLIVGASLFWLSRKVARPIKQLVRSSRALADGETGVRVGEGFDEPFGSLAASYDSMADRIERSIADQKILIGALPHEMRGPVSRLRFALDLTRNVNNLPDMRERISMMDDYLGDLEQALEQTLLLTRLQQHDEDVSWTTFDFQRTINDVVARFTDNKRINYSVDYQAPANIVGNEGLIRLVISNLVSNASRYAKSTIRLRIETNNTQNNVCLLVEDDGIGVPEDFHDELFVPFSRLEESRSRESGGIGLGLSLVELIARQHSGGVNYFTSEMEGAGFAFCWPGLSKGE